MKLALQAVLELRALHEETFRANGFKVRAANGEMVALGGMPLVVLLHIGNELVVRRLSYMDVDVLKQREGRARSTIDDAIDKLLGHGFIEKLHPHHARYGLTRAGRAAVVAWSLYNAREMFRVRRPWLKRHPGFSGRSLVSLLLTRE